MKSFKALQFHCIGHIALKRFNDIVTITAVITMISLCVIAALGLIRYSQNPGEDLSTQVVEATPPPGYIYLKEVFLLYIPKQRKVAQLPQVMKRRVVFLLVKIPCPRDGLRPSGAQGKELFPTKYPGVYSKVVVISPNRRFFYTSSSLLPGGSLEAGLWSSAH